MNILFTIRHQLNKLSKAEKKLAEWILNDPERVIHMSAKALSQASQTSPATVIRLCYSLGLEGFTDLKLQLSADQSAIKEQLYTDIVPGEGVTTIKRKLMLKVTDAIEKNCEKLTDEAIRQAVSAIETSDFLFTYGVGASGIVADDFSQKFLRIGKKIISSRDYHLMTTAVVTNEEQAATFLVSNSGEKEEVVRLAQLAKENGMTVIVLTSKANSSLAQKADILIHTTDGGEALLRSSATHSLLVQLYTVDVLFCAYATRHYEKTLLQLEKTKSTVREIEQEQINQN